MTSKTRLLGEYFPVLIIVCVITGLSFLSRATAKPISILVDGEDISFRTHARTVGKALADAEINLRDGDLVYPEEDESLVPGDVIEIRRSEMVQLEINGATREIQSASTEVGNILADATIELFPADVIWVDGIPFSELPSPLGSRARHIRMLPAREITLEIHGEKIELFTAAPTVGAALAEAGIQIFVGDRIQPPASTPTDGVSHITLRRSRLVTVHADGEVIESRVAAGTVGEALADLGIALGGPDYSIPEMGEPLPENGELRVVRVREDIIFEQNPLPFETAYMPNPELEIDQQSFEDPGAYGIVATRVRVRYEDGVEIARAIEDEWVAQEPDPRTIGYGTNIVVRTTNTPDGQIEYWRAIQMYATSYSPSRAGVPDDYEYFGITACGKKLVKGLVAIDRNYIPFYTMMYVPGYGFAEACDTGGGVRGRWIDLGYEDDNYEPWHQYVTVYFLTPIPPASSIAWIFP